MKLQTKIKIKDYAKKILDKTMKKDFPELDTEKIAKFWLKTTISITEFIKGLFFFLLFTIIFQGIMKIKPEQVTIYLLITIAYGIIQINKKTTDPEELW